MNTNRRFYLVNRGRRFFLKTAAAAVTYLFLGARTTVRAAGNVRDYLTARIAAVYGHDEKATVRRSQDNPMIEKLYDDYLGSPVSERAEELLHAEYTDRSAGVTGERRGPLH